MNDLVAVLWTLGNRGLGVLEYFLLTDLKPVLGFLVDLQKAISLEATGAGMGWGGEGREGASLLRITTKEKKENGQCFLCLRASSLGSS